MAEESKDKTKHSSYNKLYLKLQKEYESKKTQSDFLLQDYEAVRNEYIVYTNKINSLLDVLFFLTESLHNYPEDNNNTSNKEQLIKEHETILLDKERVQKLIKEQPELQNLQKLVDGDFDGLKELFNIKNVLLKNHPFDSFNNNENFIGWVESLGVLEYNEKKRLLDFEKQDNVNANGSKRRKK